MHKMYYAEAIADFTTAIELFPEFVLAYCGRGSAYERTWQYAEAIADFTTAIELAPELAMAYLGRGQAHEGAGSIAEAISDYEAFLTLSTNPDLNDWVSRRIEELGE